MTRTLSIIAALVLAAVLAGAWLLMMRSGPGDNAQCREGTIAGGGDQIGGPFTLVDETGATVTDAEVIDRPALVYFGYAFCPDVCPMDLARNAEAVDLLAARGHEVKPVFISVDPDRDTPEYLGEYTENLHERMIGLTGTPEQVKAAAQAYRVYYKKQDSEENDEYYIVDHTTFSYLVTPEDGFLEFIRRDETPEQVADKVSCYLNAR
ncbi:SCO family protein [Stappia sp.]|uniref:SCO family protein n=1 Tax=Stappia sp. TaxID=1870903 RepID=UPI003A992B36